MFPPGVALEDAAEALEEGCGCLDTITLVGAGGRKRRSEGGRQSPGLTRSERALGQTSMQ